MNRVPIYFNIILNIISTKSLYHISGEVDCQEGTEVNSRDVDKSPLVSAAVTTTQTVATNTFARARKSDDVRAISQIEV